MIIDAHCHLFWEDSDPLPFFQGCAAAGVRFLTRDESDMPDPDQLLQIQMNALSDRSGEKLVEWMDESLIERTLLLPIDFWYWYESTGQKAPISIGEKNEIYCQAVLNHEDRLVSLFGIDPRRKNAVVMFERAITEWGMLGLKLHPTARFFPDDEVCYPLYEKAADLGVPVLVHSGSEPAPMPAKYSHPKYLDTVAADFPNLKLVVAHIGHGWWRETLDLALMKPNIYIDFSGWQFQYLIDPLYVKRVIRTAIDTLGVWRVMFGSDGSMLNIILSLSDWSSAVKSFSNSSDVKFTQEEIAIIMGKAARHLYKI